MTAGTSASQGCSIGFADHGAPPTLRRISTYSIGLETLIALMLASSHSDSSSRLRVLSAKRARQSAERSGTVRDQRSASPASTGLVGLSLTCPSAGLDA